jgi:lipopolysaccharide biosynthesis glycosyltransferase
MGNILITGANDMFTESLLTLISSVHKHSIDSIETIIVYDLGLSENSYQRLERLQKVMVKRIPDEEKHKYPMLNDISSRFHKIWSLNDARSHGQNILWLDAGVMCLRDITHMYEIIERDGIFMVTDQHLNRNYTHRKCAEIMEASESEMNDKQLSAGIIGYSKGGRYQNVFEEAFKYGTLGCTMGDTENHRHDQSVFSILASRYDCPRHDIDIYGYWTDVNRNLRTAIENDAVIFVHRRGHHDIKDLKYV